MIYMRWRDGESRRGAVYTGFNPQIDMLAWTPCRICHDPLKAERWQLLAVGPHPNCAPHIERHAAGLEYSATTTFAHERCVTGCTDEELDHICSEMYWGARASV